MRYGILASLLMSAVLTATAGTTTIQPTTTLAAETGNNTSAANTFAGQSNGNLAATNISKQPIRSLLYAGATTKIYTHLMPWFGTASHVNVGYDSSDPAQAQRQVADMVSRGIDGVIVDWYGPTSTQHNTATKNVLSYAEKASNFEFAICEDYGSVSSSTNPTQKTISDLNYAWTTFMQSPAYMKRNARPVIMFFGFEGQAVDLTVVKAALTFDPLFIMRNSGGFTEVMSDGSFSWLAPLTSGYDNYMSLPYLDGFYSAQLKNSSQLGFGSGYKGFNDTLASWAPPGGRHIQQYCGQTWLSSFGEAARYFSSTNQMPALQIVTWNDYEEGTAIEPGIDNCVAITAWMTSTTLNWSITGQESTVDHYTVFASTDGTNLMSVGDVPAGTAVLDLNTLSLAPGAYQFFVKAVGKASMANHMSASVSYTQVDTTPAPAPVPPPAPAPTPAPAADYSLAATPLAVQMAQGGSANVNLSVMPVNGSYDSAVSFSCSNLPSYMGCRFSQDSVVPGTAGATTTLTLTTATSPTAKNTNVLPWTMLPAFGFLFALGSDGRKRAKRVALLLGALVVMGIAVGCGGAGTSATSSATRSSSSTLKPGNYTITIVATSGSVSHTTTASVTVQ